MNAVPPEFDASDSNPPDSNPSESNASLAGPRRSKWAAPVVFGVLALVIVLVQWPLIGGMLGLRGAPPPPDPGVWSTDYAASLAEAQATGRPMLLDFTADWCPPCRAMDREVWPREHVKEALLAATHPVKLDIDQPVAAEVAGRYGIQYIPTLVLVDGGENELARLSGFIDAETLTAWLAKHAPATPPDAPP